MANASAEELNTKQLLDLLNRRLGQIVLGAVECSGPVESEREIYEQIELSHQILSKTRFLLNSRRRINRLPFELLTSIFIQVQDQGQWALFPPATETEMSDFYSWLSLTAVCIHWRRTALSEPLLWSKIYLPSTIGDQKGLRNLLLKRASPLPLNLYHILRSEDFTPSSRKSTLRGYCAFMKQYSSQLKTVHISSPRTLDTSERVWDIFKYDFSQIEELHLSILSQCHAPIRSPLRRILGQQGLTRLSLSNLRWPAGSNNVPNLTHLCLRLQPPDFPQSYSEFLEALEGCPRLQFLSLQDAGPLTANYGAGIGHIVYLPSLRRLEISWTGTPVTRSPKLLLDHLDFADDVEIVLYPTDMSVIIQGSLINHFPALLPRKRYLDRISAVQIRSSYKCGVLLQDHFVRIDCTTEDIRSIGKCLSPLVPNASTLIFDLPFPGDLVDLSIFGFPSRFTSLQFLHPTCMLTWVIQGLTSPQIQQILGLTIPTPPTELYFPAGSDFDVHERSPSNSTKLDVYRDEDALIISREHLEQPPLKLFLDQELEAPFDGPLCPR